MVVVTQSDLFVIASRNEMEKTPHWSNSNRKQQQQQRRHSEQSTDSAHYPPVLLVVVVLTQSVIGNCLICFFIR